MEQQYDSRPTVERIQLSGEFDLSRKDELKQLLAHVDGHCPIVIDVRDVTYGDSSFLSELGQLRTRHPDCEIIIHGASPMMLKIFRLIKFNKLFTIDGFE